MKLISFFKKRCLICHTGIADQSDLCEGCVEHMRALKPVAQCRCCGIRLVQVQAFCGKCQQSPPYFNETHAVWAYDTLSAHLIHRLKFYEDFTTLPFLVTEFADMLKAAYQNRVLPEVIMSVPLHYFRLFRRGFNQSEEISKRLAKVLSLKLQSNDLKKIRATQRQLALHIDERAKNLQEAFRVDKKGVYQSVALVDDVMTTGATANEIAKMLKQAGVAEVHVWVLARAMKTR